MEDQTTITLSRSDKRRLNEDRNNVPWGTYLVGLLEKRENASICIDPSQAEEIARLSAQYMVEELEEKRY